jgi:hypothetical protein
MAIAKNDVQKFSGVLALPWLTAVNVRPILDITINTSCGACILSLLEKFDS